MLVTLKFKVNKKPYRSFFVQEVLLKRVRFAVVKCRAKVIKQLLKI